MNAILQRWPWATRMNAVTAGIFLLGLSLRGYHFARCPALWHDEAALVLNVLDKDFLELLGPLRFSEAAPPLFLWIEKLAVLAAGDNLLVLRVIPALAGCLSLVVLWVLARRWLSPPGVAIALVLVACGDRLLWHGCEAKQYAIEAFLSLMLVWTYVRTVAWPVPRRMLLMAALAPAMIWLAYPGCFLLGGYLLAELPQLWRERRWPTVVAYGVASLTTVGSFAALYWGPIAAQHDATITACWQAMDKFPDYARPATVPLWAGDALASAMDYCFRPLGLLLAPFLVIGTRALWRKTGVAVVILLLAPIGLAFVAALLQAYPFGGSRVVIFAAPLLALAIAAGATTVVERCGQHRGLVLASIALLLATLPAMAIYRVVSPWGRADCEAAVEFVRAHRVQRDPIATNHWEYEYYFRDDRNSVVAWPLEAELRAPRMWVIVTGEPATERMRLASIPPSPAHRATLQGQFERTTVVLFERRDVDFLR
jgi:hypothetical protein